MVSNLGTLWLTSLFIMDESALGGSQIWTISGIYMVGLGIETLIEFVIVGSGDDLA